MSSNDRINLFFFHFFPSPISLFLMFLILFIFFTFYTFFFIECSNICSSSFENFFFFISSSTSIPKSYASIWFRLSIFLFSIFCSWILSHSYLSTFSSISFTMSWGGLYLWIFLYFPTILDIYSHLVAYFSDRIIRASPSLLALAVLPALWTYVSPFTGTPYWITFVI